MLLRTAQVTNIFLAFVQIKMLAFLFSQFHDSAKTAKKAFAQVDPVLEIKRFYKHGRRN